MQGKVRMRVNSTEELEIKRICSSILMSVIACSGCLWKSSYALVSDFCFLPRAVWVSRSTPQTRCAGAVRTCQPYFWPEYPAGSWGRSATVAECYYFHCSAPAWIGHALSLCPVSRLWVTIGVVEPAAVAGWKKRQASGEARARAGFGASWFGCLYYYWGLLLYKHWFILWSLIKYYEISDDFLCNRNALIKFKLQRSHLLICFININIYF